MPGAANSSHVWTLTRSNAGKSAQPQAWLREMEEGQSPLLHPCPSMKIYLSATSLIPSPVSNNWLSIHTRERKLVFPVSFIPAHVCKALWEENCQTPQVISVITLDLYVPWACCRPWDQQPSLPFPGRDYVAYQKTKLITLSLKSLNSPQSVPHLQLDESERVTLARSKNVTGNTTAKPQALFLSSVCCTTLFSPSGHSGDGSPPSAYRLVYISDFLLIHLMYVN